MDPNATLRTMLEAAREVIARADAGDDVNSDGAAEDLAQRVLDLSEWLTKGGFRPSAWDGAL